MTVEKQKHVADTVLSVLKQFDPDCIVAGGAPRDWYFGDEAKDVDVYFCPPTDILPATVRKALDMEGIAVWEHISKEDIPEEYDNNPTLSCVTNCTLDNVDIQIMWMTEHVSQVVEKFPVSISQITYRDGAITPTRIFLIGQRERMIFFTGKVYASNVGYLDKIKAKFPFYTYVGF